MIDAVRAQFNDRDGVEVTILLDELHRLAPADAERVRAAARAAGWAA